MCLHSTLGAHYIYDKVRPKCRYKLHQKRTHKHTDVTNWAANIILCRKVLEGAPSK